ncbi:MAG TPA: hypothetical protein PKL31_10345 [Fulvivirga sp.]|nr:hypothetical protein [Fulvivirga sp.]
MQKKKNKRLLVVLGVALIITMVTYWLDRPTNELDVNKDLFSLSDPVNINKVTLKSPASMVTLIFENGKWRVNDRYEADPQRINVLFAILKQVKVRRQSAKNQQTALDSLFSLNGSVVNFYEGETIVKQFEVVGDPGKSLTYMEDATTKDKYLVEIPGYRSYLAGLFELDESGWRNPLVFNLNWANLQDVKVNYYGEADNSFEIVFEDRDYTVAGIKEVDSLRLTDFLDDVSLLYVDDYLTKEELGQYNGILDKPFASINIKDIGNNDYSLTVFSKIQKSKYLVKIDSLDYGLLEEKLLKKVMRPRSYFKADNRR